MLKKKNRIIVIGVTPSFGSDIPFSSLWGSVVGGGR